MSFQYKTFNLTHFRGLVFAGFIIISLFVAIKPAFAQENYTYQYDNFTISNTKPVIQQELWGTFPNGYLIEGIVLSASAEGNNVSGVYLNCTDPYFSTSSSATLLNEGKKDYVYWFDESINLGACSGIWTLEALANSEGFNYWYYGSNASSSYYGECTTAGCGDIKDIYFYFLSTGFATGTPPGLPVSRVALPSGVCDNLNIVAGALCRVIVFLFAPEQTDLTQFAQLKDIVSSKPPFGYFTSIKNSLNNLSGSSTPAFELTAQIGDIALFGTLKTGLAWILWIFFGFWVIRRIASFDF
jgi:hypothetical protein